MSFAIIRKTNPKTEIVPQKHTKTVFECIKRRLRGGNMLVQEIMKPCNAECTEDMPLAQVYDMLQRSEEGFVVVVDSAAHRVPLGVVTEHSICEQVIKRGRNPRNLAAGNVLEAQVLKVNAASIADGLFSMHDKRRKLPIVVFNEKRELCGILTPEALKPQAAASPFNRFTTSSVRELPAFGWA